MKSVAILPFILSLICLSSNIYADTAEEAASQEVAATEDSSQTQETQTEEKTALPLPLEELRKFSDVFGKIKQDYVEEVDDVTLLNYAIRGMLSSLDPHSAYLEPSAYNELQESTSGTFGGLGIEVGLENGFIKVISPIDGTPAQKGGIEAGDLIIKLDDTPVKGMSLNRAVEKMRGEVGTPITLTIVRAGTREPIEIKLVRDVIQITSIRTVQLDKNYGYIRITQFQAQTGVDFAKGIETLRNNDDELSGLIIDLRNNPGGVLQASVDVADLLLDEGLVVYTQGRSESSELRLSATEGDATNGIPIVVLINGGSASASEILAGALQDHKRAVIMGTQSFGKGSVQSVLSLTEDYGLKLTTSLYYTPNGRSIQAQGITPDIEVNRATLGDEKQSGFFKESDLAGHLSNGNGKGDAQETDSDIPDDTKSAMLERDFQLQEALNLLKAIDILKISRK